MLKSKIVVVPTILCCLCVVLAHCHAVSKCPANCTCSYETAYCSDLIDTCHECKYWSRIDFSRISNLKPEAFKYFDFAPGRTTQLIVYRLLNYRIVSDTFKNLHIPSNSHVELTFQYNSIMDFDTNSMNGIVLGANSTLIINMPYVTQVLVNTQYFDAMRFGDNNSRIIIRIIKSYIVKFLTRSMSHNQMQFNGGQFVIDIKSTFLVRFDGNSFGNLDFTGGFQFFVDLEFVEKLYICRDSFSKLTIASNSSAILYFKQVNMIHIESHAFNNINVDDSSKFFLIFSDIANSVCLKSYTFVNIGGNTFNLTFLNSKNLLVNTRAFHNIDRLALTIANKPSRLSYELETYVHAKRRRHQHTVNTELRKLFVYYIDVDDNFTSYSLDDAYLLNNMHAYVYNVKVYRNAFEIRERLHVRVGNVNTLFLDNYVANGSHSQIEMDVNCKSLVLAEYTFGNRADADIDIKLNSTKVFDLSKYRSVDGDLSSLYNQTMSLCYVNDDDETGTLNDAEFYFNEREANNTDDLHANGTTRPNKFNYVKPVGISIIGFVVFIILIMFVLNLVHYRYRNSDFDDYDAAMGNQQRIGIIWKRSFSLQSLKRAQSVSSLKRPTVKKEQTVFLDDKHVISKDNESDSNADDGI
jgi:hypothetical protein